MFTASPLIDNPNKNIDIQGKADNINFFEGS